jgi:2-polyprenyl-3-methyl-5-hydroxy-6-metoxy-1,4-benzoquinol methylase
MIRFAKRSEEKELLDDFQCEGEDLEQNLRELRFINKWLGGNEVTLRALGKSVPEKLPALNRLCIADLGCGGGDMLREIARWSRNKKLSVELSGIDANDFIIAYAQRHSQDYPEINYQVLNVFSEDFSRQTFDIVNCTLFCHHIEDASLIRLLAQLRTQVRVAVVINDLHRHWLAYYSIKWLTYFFSRSYMVRHDAKLSVLRGFRKKELEHLIRAAGYTDFSIRWRWAFRWEVLLKK